MFYKLNDNVFIVDGAVGSAIYDLNTLKLYHIDNKAANFIRKTFNGVKPDEMSDDELTFLDSLIKNKLILETNLKYKEIPITSLKKDLKPIFAWIEITQKCNLKCVFCYEESSYQIKKMMTMDDFHKAINFLIEYGIKNIQFIGGEPMLHPNLKEMIDECIGKFDFIEVYTNGTYITQEWCDYFKKNDIKLAISYHSFIPEELEKITQIKGSAKLIQNGVDLVLKNNIHARFASIENKDVNIGTKPKNLDIDLKVQPPRLTGRGQINQFNIDMFKQTVISQKTFTKPLNREFIIKSVSGHQCFNKNLYIAYNLEVFPCVMERRISHGFIKDCNNIKIINSNICKMNKDFINECKSCEFRYTCYDCRPNCNGGGINDKP